MPRHPLMIVALLATAALPLPTSGAATQPTVAASAAAGSLHLPLPKPGRVRPLVVVLADNAGSEITDFMIPYGVLKESGVADVESVSTGPGPVHLFHALSIVADQTIAQFDAATPAGADIVVVPAMAHGTDPRLVAWLRSQSARGATIVSICDGAETVAAAGLLEGKRATAYWSDLGRLQKDYPRTTWVRDHRYVQDGRVISTSGVTAAIPTSLALVEAMAGRQAAAATAARVGARGWSVAHRTADFSYSAGLLSEMLVNMLAFWRRETVEIPVASGVDEVAVALEADAWSATLRDQVVTTNPSVVEVRSRHGLRLRVDARPAEGDVVYRAPPRPAVAQLDATLADIGRRYGPAAVTLVALNLEYSPR